MKTKTIFITGANGFAGTHLKAYLSPKYKILAPSRAQLDLLDEKAVDKFFVQHKIDVVVHTALVGGSRNEEAVEDEISRNVRMFFNIVKNKKKFKKLINCGSGAEYDKRFPIKQVTEADFGKSIPVDDYGLCKYIFSKYIENGSGMVDVRIFALFGQGDDWRYRFISNAICKNIFGLPITIRQNVYFDYIYIKDFVRIIEYFIENTGRYRAYNLGTGERRNILQIAKKINQISNKKSKIKIEKKGLNNEYTSDNKRLLKEIKGFKFTPFETYMTEMYNWYKDNIDLIDKKQL